MHSYKESLKKKFEEAYNNLNTQQRIAVDTIEGPVMVIAGPGTGKTQILAARIGKILLDTDAAPDNILCLTYTDAGAIAMRRRLQQFIGADAYKVNIYTFHAFCNDVIQDNLSLFEKNSLDPISELESMQLFKNLIDSFPKNHPLKRYRGDVYFETGNLRNLFSNMKREGWKAAFILEKIEEYINSLPEREDFVYKRKYKQFNAGDLKLDKIEEEKERMEKLRAAVNEFDRYQELMRKRNRYDFDDMINWVIKVFEENKNVLAAYQEKFQYILVDEFQDTSGTQNRLVQLLINYWEVPNVFVVGDDDQSIYRFQGANVENMIEFANQYSEALKTVVLTNNYRSTQPILDISKSLINKNQERLVKQLPGLSKDLLSSNSKLSQLTHLPKLQEFNSVKEEMAGITHAVHQLLADGIAPGRIAIIYKENKYGEELATYFRLKGLPVYSKRSINLLHDPFINKLVTLLRYLAAEHDIPYGGDELLFEILHYDFYAIPPIEIAKLTVEVNTKKYAGEQISIRKLLADRANAPARDLFDTGINSGLKNTSYIIELLIADVPNVTLQQLFENIIQKAGVLPYIMQHPKKLALMQILTAFFDFIKEETSRNPYLTLEGLINIIDLMQHESIALSMQQVSGSDKGVNLLTAHGSKGLEFEYVFFAGVNAASWEKKRKPGGGYKLPDTMFSQAAAADDEELRRLFYVALTRAEMHLSISWARYKNDGKELEPSMFIAEILEEHPGIPIEKAHVTQEELFEFQSLQFAAQAPEIDKAEEEFISRLLEKFVMNVTALNSYLKCPLQFYYQNLIRIPSGKNEATEFGSAVHHALEKLFRKMQDSGTETFPSKEEMLSDFSWYMKKHRENFTKEAFERRMEYGEEVLRNYYDKYINNWNRVVAVERNIRGVLVNSVPLKGKLDKLEFNGKEINVVDYKSGDIDKAIPKMRGPSDKEPNGGDYWRQAVFYKLLIDNYQQKDWRVISTEFDFVEPDKKKEYRKEKITITPADTETVTQQLTATWQKIQDRDFYTGCGKEDCHWCNFVKNNQLEIALHDLEEEE
ncbi:MAG: ATP-dependent helicase [Chitinophagaceae bacterium]|nr:MAG: ATP-dependent helicase [Chitinophagaceae bacterium]